MYDVVFVCTSCIAMPSDYLKIIPHYLLPKRTLTTLAGVLANVKNPRIKNYLIQHFIHKYNINMLDASEEMAENYETFNHFFIRHLKPGCRPLEQADIVSPVDGFISEIGSITDGKLVQAKGRHYTVAELLGGEDKAALFSQGLFVTLYLSPRDYHRVHMPIQGLLQETLYVPGRLFSVQPLTARIIPRLFATNERLISFFDTAVGPMAMVLVGATVVGAIGTVWQGDIPRSKQRQHTFFSQTKQGELLLQKGSEMGYFKLGSTVILLFANGNQLTWEPHLRASDPIQLGHALATKHNTPT